MRECDDEGFWSDWEACHDTDDCVDGDEEEQACGLNNRGTSSRTCTLGHWGEWGPCADPDECADGDEQAEACGVNGRGERLQACEGGSWSGWGDCVDPDECLDGAAEQQPCANGNGQQQRGCLQGRWSPWSECPDPTQVLFYAQRWPGYVAATEALYLEAGVAAETVDALPADLAPYRLIYLNNPSDEVSDEDVARLVAFVGMQRRLVILGDHCKFGCFADQDRLDAVFAALQLGMSYDTQAGLLNGADAQVVPHRLTEGVDAIHFQYTGGLVGLGPLVEPLARVGDDGDVLAAWVRPPFSDAERYGDVVVIADMDTLNYGPRLEGTARFVMNLYLVP